MCHSLVFDTKGTECFQSEFRDWTELCEEIRAANFFCSKRPLVVKRESSVEAAGVQKNLHRRLVLVKMACQVDSG